jgi:glycosyltransferase involved in cell wall biosynthesis
MASTIRDGMSCEGYPRPKVSICIPSYNNGSLIGPAIRSVLDQTFRDIEIIVVDNGSADDSERVVRSFCDERIKFSKNNKNIGMTRNWNRCISMASGEFICLLCADDLYLPTFVERTLSMLETHPNIGFVHCACRTINDRGETVGESRVHEGGAIEIGSAFFDRIIHGNFAIISAAMFRRNCFEELGCFDEELEFAPDWEMFARISLHYDVGYVSHPLACYRIHENNFTKSLMRSNRLVHEGFKTIDRMNHDLASVPPFHSKEFVPSVLKSEYVMRVMGVRLNCSDSKEMRRSMVEEVSKNRRKVLDLRLTIPFIASYLGTGTALASLYPSKLANSMLVRIVNKIDRLM